MFYAIIHFETEKEKKELLMFNTIVNIMFENTTYVAKELK